jgi:hypothetical protein
VTGSAMATDPIMRVVDKSLTDEDLVSHVAIAQELQMSRARVQAVCAQAQNKMLIRLALATNPRGFWKWMRE